MNGFEMCPHPRESFKKEQNLYSYRCPECEARVCLDCRRHGWRDFMIPLVSWMTGLCEDCYRTRAKRADVRKRFLDYQRDRQSLERAWADGRDAGPGAVNPHAEPGPNETYLLEQNDWLRDEVTE